MKLDSYLLTFLPLWLLQVLSAHIAAAPNITTDQAALVALRSQITSNVLTHNWSTSVSVCTWVGITCGARHHRVRALDLSHFGLEGTLSSRIGDLSFLARLSLRNNSFHGPLPEELYKLRRLKVLDLGFNAFNGSIPSSLRWLQKLEDVSLEANSFTGYLPTSSLLNLPSLKSLNASRNWLSGLMPLTNPSDFTSPLQVIDLSFNNLSDAISDEFFSIVPELQGVYLSWNELHGEFATSLFKCKQLQVVSLSNNKLTGNVRAEIGNLTLLRYLYLDHNNFSGEIPEEIGQLTKMEILSLSNNRFSGSIPRTIGNCTLLEEINLADNSITGAIPVDIGILPNLKSCRMDRNGLSSDIPPGVYNISTLQILTLDTNNLSGSLPLNLFLPNLEELVLARNKMQGTIPGSIRNASKLTSIDFSENLFAGFIPSALCDLDNLQKLDLGNNHLSIDTSTAESSFFSRLANCQKLSKLVLSGNALSIPLHQVLTRNVSASLQQFWANNCNINGRIPEVGNLTNLIALHLEYNQLVSELPSTLGRMGKLQGLYLQGNHLEGTITPDICHLDNLFELSLGGNNLSGSIPECLGNLTSLRHLNLSSNKISSIVPMTVWRLENMLSINISSNFLTGSLPQLINNLVIVEIDLSDNKLSGEIPEIGALQSLTYLSLAKNKLQGPLPQTAVSLISLEFLDLSFNNLSGAIPKKLEELRYLKYFNVSFNRLQGEIPDGGPFRNFSAQSYLQNNDLCGARRLQVPPCRKKRILLLMEIICPITVFVMLFSLIMWFIRKNDYESSVVTKDPSLPNILVRGIITYEELERATRGFHEDCLIGKGSFSSVYLAQLVSGEKFAVKVFKAEEVRSLLSFYVEFNLMLDPLAPRPRHRNIIRMVGSVETRSLIALVMAYMPNGSLDRWMHSPTHSLDMVQRLNIMLDIASALKYLHHDYARVIVHCDIKPSNILLDEEMVAHVCDFSIAQMLHPDVMDTRGESTIFGTFGYVAPECGTHGLVSTKSDVYSFGIVLMEAFTGKRPTDEMFGGDMSLRSWVMELLACDKTTAMDPALLQPEEQHLHAKQETFLNLMWLACCCSAQSPNERFGMEKVLTKLEKIKRSYLNASTSSATTPTEDVIDFFNDDPFPVLRNHQWSLMKQQQMWLQHQNKVFAKSAPNPEPAPQVETLIGCSTVNSKLGLLKEMNWYIL